MTEFNIFVEVIEAGDEYECRLKEQGSKKRLNAEAEYIMKYSCARLSVF